MVLARDAPFAEAMATELGNRVGGEEEIEAAINWASEMEGVMQALVIVGGSLGVTGEFELQGIGGG